MATSRLARYVIRLITTANNSQTTLALTEIFYIFKLAGTLFKHNIAAQILKQNFDNNSQFYLKEKY